jgi:SAM-dependent methyltransferase
MILAQHLDRLTQTVLAPGSAAHLAKRATELLDGLKPEAPILDAGCGFHSPLALIGRRPVGVDLSERRLRERDAPGVAADAALLPFADGVFAAAFSFGLLHHLRDEAARQAIGEMGRVVGDRGLVAIFDGVTPERGRERPAAAVIRALDRGRHMRSETRLRALFDDRFAWRFERVTYAATGLEGLWCISGPPPPPPPPTPGQAGRSSSTAGRGAGAMIAT